MSDKELLDIQDVIKKLGAIKAEDFSPEKEKAYLIFLGDAMKKLGVYTNIFLLSEEEKRILRDSMAYLVALRALATATAYFLPSKTTKRVVDKRDLQSNILVILTLATLSDNGDDVNTGQAFKITVDFICEKFTLEPEKIANLYRLLTS